MTGFGSAIAQREVARGTQAWRNRWRGGWLVCLVLAAAVVLLHRLRPPAASRPRRSSRRGRR